MKEPDETNDGDKTPPSTVRDGQIVVAVSGIWAMVGALALVTSYFATTRWKSWAPDATNTSMREKVRALAQGFLLQLTWLSISNFLEGLFFALSLGIPRDFSINTTCIVQSIGRTYFPISTACWNLVLAFELHHVMRSLESIRRFNHNLDGSFLWHRFLYYHIIGWGPAAAITILLYAKFGKLNEGIWCWTVVLNHQGDLLGGYHAIPQIITWIMVVLLNIHTGIMLKRMMEETQSNFALKTRKFVLTLLLYSTTFILTWIAMLLHELHVDYRKDRLIYGSSGIRYVAAATAPAQGLLNCLVFLSTNSKAREWIFCGSKNDLTGSNKNNGASMATISAAYPDEPTGSGNTSPSPCIRLNSLGQQEPLLPKPSSGEESNTLDVEGYYASRGSTGSKRDDIVL
eukprot:gb/GECG01012440.1/.p1 GENE.gb/GECG01012440.1/~~gb/GECG01012440.1/.p1  ORF type:complete len:401 (+),score=22.95 gb/GECG01012440.1/:1-1203(+)